MNNNDLNIRQLIENKLFPLTEIMEKMEKMKSMENEINEIDEIDDPEIVFIKVREYYISLAIIHDNIESINENIKGIMNETIQYITTLHAPHRRKKKKRVILGIGDKKIIQTELLCQICLSNEKKYVCVPCGHKCLCFECKTRIDNICPICRTDIDVIITEEELEKEKKILQNKIEKMEELKMKLEKFKNMKIYT